MWDFNLFVMAFSMKLGKFKKFIENIYARDSEEHKTYVMHVSEVLQKKSK